MLVLEFLLEKAQESKQAQLIPGQPEGRIQIVVSTHSPNLTAWVSPKHLVVARSQQAAPQANRSPIPAAATTALPLAMRTVAIPIARLGIADKMIDKISRYLDVTRSAMLFGNKALFVEGIAEALLLPAIAKFHVFKTDHNALLRFKGTVLVPIDGVDFRPYVEVLLRPHNGARIADRVVVITDADPEVEGNRKADLESFATEVGASDALHVFVNQRTLEHELLSAGNEAILKTVFLKLHPRSGDDWTQKIENIVAADRPDAFLALIEAKKTRKGDLAQEIAARIAAGDAFQVPDYLKNALLKIVEL